MHFPQYVPSLPGETQFTQGLITTMRDYLEKEKGHVFLCMNNVNKRG